MPVYRNLWEHIGPNMPLIYDYVSGFSRENGDGTSTLVNGKLKLFWNFDSDTHQPLGLPNTIGNGSAEPTAPTPARPSATRNSSGK